jgi:hypothetical protein
MRRERAPAVGKNYLPRAPVRDFEWSAGCTSQALRNEAPPLFLHGGAALFRLRTGSVEFLCGPRRGGRVPASLACVPARAHLPKLAKSQSLWTSIWSAMDRRCNHFLLSTAASIIISKPVLRPIRTTRSTVLRVFAPVLSDSCTSGVAPAETIFAATDTRRGGTILVAVNIPRSFLWNEWSVGIPSRPCRLGNKFRTVGWLQAIIYCSRCKSRCPPAESNATTSFQLNRRNERCGGLDRPEQETIVFPSIHP